MSIDRRRGVVRIGGREFLAHLRDDAYLLEIDDGVLRGLPEIRFRDIPGELVLRIRVYPERGFRLLHRFTVDVGRDVFALTLTVYRDGDALIGADEYCSELRSSLERLGLAPSLGEGLGYIVVKAGRRPQGDEAVAHAIGLLNDAVSAVNRWAEEGEARMISIVNQWAERIRLLDGRSLSSLRSIRGVAKW